MEKQASKVLLYGANGYTGRLICRVMAEQGMTPVLAGRSREAIAPMAELYGWEARIFPLDGPEHIAPNLQDIKVVLHAAGPFRDTAAAMMQACMATQTHYLDITGEIEVFALAHKWDAAAKQAGVMLMPGTGFDVVPTDCMALLLKENMPDATQLELAFVTLGGQISHGTAMSMAGKLGEGGASRQNGKLVKEPLAKKARTIAAGGKSFFVMSIPWGDVFTAFITTGIPFISTYTGAKPSMYNILKLQGLFNPLLRTALFRNWIKKKIKARPAGPDDASRAKAKAYIWGEVRNASGKTVQHWFCCPEGYTLTALTATAITQKVLAGLAKPGYQTPAGCFGSALINAWITEKGPILQA